MSFLYAATCRKSNIKERHLCQCWKNTVMNQAFHLHEFFPLQTRKMAHRWKYDVYKILSKLSRLACILVCMYKRIILKGYGATGSVKEPAALSGKVFVKDGIFFHCLHKRRPLSHFCLSVCFLRIGPASLSSYWVPKYRWSRHSEFLLEKKWWKTPNALNWALWNNWLQILPELIQNISRIFGDPLAGTLGNPRWRYESG